MRRPLLLTTAFMMIFYSLIAFSDVTTREVEYFAGPAKMIGFLALPAQVKPNTPAVLVVHEWWGQTDYIRRRARELAEAGYIGFAIDLYGQRKIAEHPQNAKEFSKSVMQNAESVAIPFNAALAALRKEPMVDKTRIAGIGYCFGGAVLLEMLRQGTDLKSIVTFHAGLMTPSKAKAGGKFPKVLVINGAKDSMVKSEDITAFKDEMKKIGAGLEFIDMPNAMHGFTNPAADENGKKYNIPLAYNKEADIKSWAKMLEFFKKSL